MSTTKIVVLGAINGKFSVFKKLAKLHSQQAFSFAIVCGDLFADDANVADVEIKNKDEDGGQSIPDDAQQNTRDSIQKLVDGEIIVPLPTYFTVGRYALPRKIVDRLTDNNSEVCSNLFFLAKRSIFTTSDGVRIVSLGGLKSDSVIANVDDGKYLPFHTEQDAKILHGANTADILLTTSWPAGVRNGSAVVLPDGSQEPRSEQYIAELVMTLKPRYHFCTSPDLFYEREPFVHVATDHASVLKPVTRFLNLASTDSTTKQKSVYAFKLESVSSALSQLPAGVTAAPFISPTKAKRPLQSQFDSSYRYANADRDCYDGYNQNKRRRKAPHSRAQPLRTECFFCLANNPSTHLIAAIGEDAYLTTSRGPVPTAETFQSYFDCPAQILIIPFAHAPTIASIPSSAGDNLERQNSYNEMLRFRRALNEMVQVKGEGKLGSVCWEVNKQAGVHIHWQWMPIPLDFIQNRLVEAGLKVQAEGNGYAGFEQREVGDGVGLAGDWFRIWLWEPSQDSDSAENTEASWFLPFDPSQRFDLQFGRTVMAKLLGTPERAHWKDVVQSEEEEKKEVDAFKTAFKKWDFTDS